MPGPSHYLVNKLAYKKEVNTYQLQFCLQSFKVYGEHGRNGAQFIDNIERE